MSDLCRCSKDPLPNPFQCVHLPWCERIAVLDVASDRYKAVLKLIAESSVEDTVNIWAREALEQGRSDE